MFERLKKKYVEVCERIEADTERMRAERRTLEEARKARRAVDATIAKADSLLSKSDKQ